MIGARDHLVAGPDAEREQREVHRGGARGDGEHVLGLEVRGHALLEQRGPRAGRQPAGAERLGDGGDLLLPDRGRLEAEPGATTRPHRPGSVRPRAARRARVERVVAVGPGREDRAGPVGAAPERPEDVPRAAVDPHPLDAVDRLAPPRRPSTAAQHALRRDEEDDARAARASAAPRAAGSSHAPARRARTRPRESLRSTPVAARQSSASWPPPSRAATSITHRAVRPEPDLRVGRPVADPERRDGGPRARRRRARSSCADGQTCASATPNAGGSAISRSVTVSGVKRPSSETAFTVTSGPSTSSSTSTPPPRDSASAASSAAASSAGSRTSVEPALALPVGRLDDAGERERRVARVERRARAARRPRRTPRAAASSTSRARRCARRSDAAGRAARRRARRSRPASRRRARRSRRRRGRARAARSPSSSSDEITARSSASANPTACGSRSTAITSRSRAPARPRAGRAAPGRRLGRGDAVAAEDAPPPGLVLAVPGDRPLEPVVEAVARAPAGQRAPSCRSSRCGGRPGPGRSATCTFVASGFADRVEHEVGDLGDRDVDAGRDVHDLAGDRVERRVDQRLDRLARVVDVQPVAARVPSPWIVSGSPASACVMKRGTTFSGCCRGP